MKFWDSSGLVPLLVDEPMSARLRPMAARDPAMFVWWGSSVECISAFARHERDGSMDSEGIASALKRLTQLANGWHEIDPSDAIRESAARFLRVHPLRAADALQLAAAFLAAERRPPTLEMITLDERLAAAARKEGFAVIDLGA